MTRVASRPAALARAAGNRVPRNRRTPPPAPKLVRPSWSERFREVSDSRRWPKVVGRVDGVLFGTVVALIVFGVVMVYSASSVRAQREFRANG